MNKVAHPSAEALAKLEELLKLQRGPHCQDWDIELADPHRVEEFLDLYESGKLNEPDRFALMQLIVASFDELLHRGGNADRAWGRIKTHLLSERTLHQPTVEYWSCNDPEETGFPATAYIRQLNAMHSVTLKT